MIKRPRFKRTLTRRDEHLACLAERRKKQIAKLREAKNRKGYLLESNYYKVLASRNEGERKMLVLGLFSREKQIEYEDEVKSPVEKKVI